MARDAIARQYDVDADSVKLVRPEGQKGGYQQGTIHFAPKQGKSIDLEKIHESITATRLSGGTNMGVTFLEITARGEVMQRGTDLVLKVSRTGEEFVLNDDPMAKDALSKLRQAIANGARVTTVTGRVPGWTGRFPDVLKAWSKASDSQKQRLGVTDFEADKK